MPSVHRFWWAGTYSKFYRTAACLWHMPILKEAHILFSWQQTNYGTSASDQKCQQWFWLAELFLENYMYNCFTLCHQTFYKILPSSLAKDDNTPCLSLTNTVSSPMASEDDVSVVVLEMFCHYFEEDCYFFFITELFLSYFYSTTKC